MAVNNRLDICLRKIFVSLGHFTDHQPVVLDYDICLCAGSLINTMCCRSHQTVAMFTSGGD